MCAETAILESVSASVILMCCEKYGREPPEDGVDKRRNVVGVKNR
jgi:hypothetical protein